MNYQFQPTCQIPPGTLDEIYVAAFGKKNTGTFVEIGAHDGWHWSCTWGLAQAGWRGVYVEPVPELFQECIKTNANLPLIRIHNCCIGNANEEVTLGMGEYGACALSKEKPFKVTQYTLDRLLTTEAIPPGFDLLVIDVEGIEPQVLEGFTPSYWRPKLVIIERPPKPNKLTELGYAQVYEDWINTIYQRPD